MPLTKEQISQRRTMSPETCRDHDLFRIAEAVERIDETLAVIARSLSSQVAHQERKEPFG